MARRCARSHCRTPRSQARRAVALELEDCSTARPCDEGGLMGHVNKVSHVFTLGHVAEMLGEDEEWLFEVAEEMDTEDGQLWVVGVGEDGAMAFTDDQAENRRVRLGLTINWTDQRTCGLPRMVTLRSVAERVRRLGRRAPLSG